MLRPLFAPLMLLTATAPAAPQVSVCYDYGCATREHVTLHDRGWQRVRKSFVPTAKSAAAERAQIRQAIALMEQTIGEQTPTNIDRGAHNYRDSAEHGHMDCIDESTNTAGYLRLFETQGLMRFHHSRAPVKRRSMLFSIHWSAQIEERETGQRWAVDSWYQDNGKPPFIQPIVDWLAKRPFPREQLAKTSN